MVVVIGCKVDGYEGEKQVDNRRGNPASPLQVRAINSEADHKGSASGKETRNQTAKRADQQRGKINPDFRDLFLIVGVVGYVHHEVMQFPEHILRSVAFLGYQDKSGDWQVKGTAFFIRKTLSYGDYLPTYLVTAAHNIFKADELGLTSLGIRLNRHDGLPPEWIDIPIDQFRLHPAHQGGLECIDVAATRIDIDYLKFDFIALGYESLLSAEDMIEECVSLGDEIAIIGLFKNHVGVKRNEPIVRAGNICSMPVDKVVTDLGEMSAFLVEARSLGGISGSPVLLYMESFRGRRLKLDPATYQRNVNAHVMEFTAAEKWRIFAILGLVQGHYDLTAIGDEGSRDSKPQKINQGVAIVVPSLKILETLDQQYFLGLESVEMDSRYPNS